MSIITASIVNAGKPRHWLIAALGLASGMVAALLLHAA